MKLIHSFLLCLCCGLLFAQNNTPLNYSKIKINLETTQLVDIARLGLEVDHGLLAKNRYLINDFSSEEIDLLRQNNVAFEILVEDVVAYYQDQDRHDHPEHHKVVGNSKLTANPFPCEALVGDYTTPANYQAGSMGGYLTYDELMVTLDSMRAKYPNLISAKAPVGTLQTFEGRPIHWLRVSDNPDVDEVEPELLYTALHHAREPNSMAQMVFYLWYLLENYDSDAEVKYLVDNTEMYFMPCVNPDGYIYNETTNPSGGGLWRKNRRKDVDSSAYGVDLNRNYGYEWGFDDNGSSPYNSSSVFRGPAPFSEPETQAVKELADAHEFQIALNYHVYGNLLVHPWGYNDQPTSEDAVFKAFGNLMTKENNYQVGTATETVGYIVNGNSDDWQYGETGTKPPIYALTPEVSTSGFWPQPNEIIDLNKSVLQQNLVTAHLVLNYAELEDLSPDVLTSTTGILDYRFTKYGLADGPITVTFSSLSPDVVVTSAPQTLNLPHLGNQILTLEYQLPTNAPSEIVFVAELDNGLYTFRHEFTKQFFSAPAVVFSDNADDFSNWVSPLGWGTTTAEFYSAPSSLTDSPNGNYAEYTDNVVGIKDPIDLTNAQAAVLRFRAKWDIDPEAYDYAQVLVAIDGSNFEAQCGNYTKVGRLTPLPAYVRAQEEWVLEEVNLSNYLGEKIRLRFAMISSFGIPHDGIYIDDIEVLVDTGIVAATTALSSNLEDLKVHPNPVNDRLMLDFSLAESSKMVRATLFNTIGQAVLVKDFGIRSRGKHQAGLDVANLEAGCYFLELKTDDGSKANRRVLIY